MKYFNVVKLILIFLVGLSSSICAQVNHAIFAGGVDDGHALSTYTQSSNNSIFKGGSGDGFDVESFFQLTNNAIFAGGIADGFSQQTYLQPVNSGIFAGGPGDGHSVELGFPGNPNNDCTQHTLDVTDILINESLDHTFKAQQVITSGASLTTFNEFLFRAASEIELQPGFTVPDMVTFNLEIGPCVAPGAQNNR